RDLSRPMIALYVGGMGAKGRNFYNDLARRYGYEAEAEKIQDLYLAGKKDEAAAAVPAEFAELMNLVGPAGYVKERLQAFKEAGVTTLNVTPVGENPAALVAQVKEWLA
ncbi:LLM class flavin-dependent oxidoreductase, partial [Kibdelosporangium lantanae]